jgi:predicted nucleic acid-binding protein
MGVFIDSNILVYAWDADAGEKHARARALIQDIWRRRRFPSVSIQVLQEVHGNLVRKGTCVEESGRRVSRYLRWRVVENTRTLFESELQIQRRWQLSLWEASSVAAGLRAQAAELGTEDLTEGQRFEGMVVLNPLVTERPAGRENMD